MKLISAPPQRLMSMSEPIQPTTPFRETNRLTQFPSGSSPEGFLCQTLNMKETSSLIIGARIPHRTGIYPVIHVERSQYRTSRQAGDEWENENPATLRNAP